MARESHRTALQRDETLIVFLAALLPRVSDAFRTFDEAIVSRAHSSLVRLRHVLIGPFAAAGCWRCRLVSLRQGAPSRGTVNAWRRLLFTTRDAPRQFQGLVEADQRLVPACGERSRSLSSALVRRHRRTQGNDQTTHLVVASSRRARWWVWQSQSGRWD